jgi:hypothetical protein
MGILRQRNPYRLVPIHPSNAFNKDWAVLLEATTIVGPRANKFRVSSATQEKNVVQRLAWSRGETFLAGSHRRTFMVIEDYNPRIHVLLFCPQLYQCDQTGRLSPLNGEEIGRFIAQALAQKAPQRHPWYNPLHAVPTEPVFNEPMPGDYDTLVVEPALSAPLVPAAVEHQDLIPSLNAHSVESLPAK